MIDFYSNKKNTVPRFFYRNYLKYIRTNNVSNEEAIKTFSDLLNLAQKSDFLKFTWNLPEYFKKHLDEEILVLAAGHDGILLYKNNENTFSFLGKISTSYVNSVKIKNKIIYAATEDGIDIIQINH